MRRELKHMLSFMLSFVMIFSVLFDIPFKFPFSKQIVEASWTAGYAPVHDTGGQASAISTNKTYIWCFSLVSVPDILQNEILKVDHSSGTTVMGYKLASVFDNVDAKIFTGFRHIGSHKLPANKDFLYYNSAFGDYTKIHNEVSVVDMPGLGSGFIEYSENTELPNNTPALNELNAYVQSPDQMQELIDWFGSKGCDVSSYDPSKTLLIVEPLLCWSAHGTSDWFGYTYQAVREWDINGFGTNTAGVCYGVGGPMNPFSHMSPTSTMRGSGSHDIGGAGTEVWTDDGVGSSTQKLNISLGGIYQESAIYPTTTKVFDGTSGYYVIGANIGQTYLGGGKRTASNVSIVYDGTVGTSEASNFHVYHEVNTDIEGSSTEIYGDSKFHETGETWTTTPAIANTLGIGSDSDLDNFSLIFADTYALLNNVDNVTVDALESYLDLSPSDLSVTWGNAAISGATHNFGSKYTLTGLGYKGNMGSAEIPTLGVASGVGGGLNAFVEKTGSYSNVPFTDTNTRHANELLGLAASKGDAEVLRSPNAMEQGKKHGLSVNVYAKGDPIISKLIVVNYTATGTSSTSEQSEYTTSNNGSFTTPEGSRWMITVPNGDPMSFKNGGESDVVNRVSISTTPDEAITNFRDSFTGSTKEFDNSVPPGDSIAVGTKDNDGYTVYILTVDGDFHVDASIILQDYELNRIYTDIVHEVFQQNGLSRTPSVSLVSNIRTIDPEKGTTVSCSYHDFKAKKYAVSDYNYKIKITETDSGTLASYDDSLGSTKILLYNSNNGVWNTRDVWTGTKEVNSATEGGSVVTYDVNLVRSASGDIRTLSGLSAVSSEWKTFCMDTLKMDYGTKPNTVVDANTTRSSNALVTGSFHDTMSWDAIFKVTNSKTKKEIPGTQSNHNSFKYETGDPPHDVYCGNHYYHVLESVEDACTIFDTPDGGQVCSFEINYTELFHKYSTLTNEIGVANKTGIVGGNPAIEDAGSLDSDNTYKVAIVENNASGGANSVTLKYYPEVEMRAVRYSGSSTTDSSYIDSGYNKESGYIAHEIYTMGEKQRESYSASMYIYRIEKSGSSDVTGSVYSDGTATGVGAGELASNLPVIYAGSDVTLTTDLNFRINLYGYSLDVVDGGRDSTYLRGVSYNDIVANGDNVYSDWGNGSSGENATKLKAAFVSWVNDMLDVERYGADISLEVTGSGVDKTYNNFSASVGEVTKPVVAETDAYQLIFNRGELVKTEPSYQALISQIAEDYGVSESEAETLFMDSEIYTAILNAIESSKSADNKSQPDPIGELGSDGHWYDESVKTIVVRRFEASSAEVRGIVLQDKIDYGSAPTSSSTGSSNRHDVMNKAAVGKWYLTLYFKDKPACLGSGSDYQPSDRNSSISSAINSFAVLVDKLYIERADFKIPNSTTVDMH